MASKNEIISDWLKSKDVEKELKISSCNLMHLRVGRKLNFKKEGNAFFYSSEDILKMKRNKTN
jgi:hypothetical protein